MAIRIRSYIGTAPKVDLIKMNEVDLVDQMWAYLLAATEKVVSGERAFFSFPDQAVDFTATPRAHGGLVDLRLCYTGVDRRATVSRDSFVAAVAEAGAVFFEGLGRVLPGASSTYRDELLKIERLRAAVRH